MDVLRAEAARLAADGWDVAMNGSDRMTASKRGLQPAWMRAINTACAVVIIAGGVLWWNVTAPWAGLVMIVPGLAILVMAWLPRKNTWDLSVGADGIVRRRWRWS